MISHWKTFSFRCVVYFNSIQTPILSHHLPPFAILLSPYFNLSKMPLLSLTYSWCISHINQVDLIIFNVVI